MATNLSSLSANQSLPLNHAFPVEHFRKHQRWTDRLKKSLFFERAEQDVSAAQDEIGLADAGALFGHDAEIISLIRPGV
jgi:hypothetical protein